jgi:hypothetical protein
MNYRLGRLEDKVTVDTYVHESEETIAEVTEKFSSYMKCLNFD